MAQEQSIQTPLGITVSASSEIQVEPDIVFLNFVVSSLQEKPSDAFQNVRKTSLNVRKYLEQSSVDEIGTSKINIRQSFRHSSGEQKFIGYTAKISFQVLLRQLDKMEDVLSGIVDIGVNEIASVDFQTTRLKEIQTEAYIQALNAAREKAEIYCRAAGITLGKIIHIEDVKPKDLRDFSEATLGSSRNLTSFTPMDIVVRASVIVAYKIEY